MKFKMKSKNKIQTKYQKRNLTIKKQLLRSIKTTKK